MAICDTCGKKIDGYALYIPKVTIDGLVYVPICADCLDCARDLATPALQLVVT